MTRKQKDEESAQATVVKTHEFLFKAGQAMKKDLEMSKEIGYAVVIELPNYTMIYVPVNYRVTILSLVFFLADNIKMGEELIHVLLCIVLYIN